MFRKELGKMAKAKSIMVQGTMSNVGKSILVGGLCRVFQQDGYKVAPFKSQNMALNSFITKEGLEMGRAQVMQAEAANIEPEVAMNPILLKPTNDMGSQVIVNGKVEATMSAREYYANKKKLIPRILEAYDLLEKRYDIIVLEGAGSPAEINLKQDDIVNMGMAQMVKAPVLLAGDIDRGGVFAQLLGTISLLTREEQTYVKGFIINKFRGDKSILAPGLTMLEEKGGVPILGVMPYIPLDIDEEDSLSERFQKKVPIGLVDIAVIRLPRISNFTDFHPFECVEGVSVRYVSTPQALQEPDIIILPGTKNTIQDLLWLRQTGMEAKILQMASKNKIIFGVCGGYQMLGETIYDLDGVEQKGIIRGLGLLPIKTVFQVEKVRTRVKGTIEKVQGKLSALTGVAFEGYEIHMGTSELIGNGKGFSLLWEKEEKEKKADGAWKENIYGTYVHGLFDQEEIVKTILSSVLKEKGIDSSSLKAFSMEEYKERQYNLLADAIRENLDMDAIYEIMERGM